MGKERDAFPENKMKSNPQRHFIPTNRSPGPRGLLQDSKVCLTPFVYWTWFAVFNQLNEGSCSTTLDLNQHGCFLGFYQYQGVDSRFVLARPVVFNLKGLANLHPLGASTY